MSLNVSLQITNKHLFSYNYLHKQQIKSFDIQIYIRRTQFQNILYILSLMHTITDLQQSLLLCMEKTSKLETMNNKANFKLCRVFVNHKP